MASNGSSKFQLTQYYVGLNYLAYLCWEKRVSKRKVCEYLGVSHALFNYYFHNPFDRLTLGQLSKLAEFLGLPLQRVIYLSLPMKVRRHKINVVGTPFETINKKPKTSNWFEDYDD